MVGYNVFIVDSVAPRLTSLKNLLNDFCPFFSIVGEYQHFYKALIETEIKKPNIIFIDSLFYTPQTKEVFQELVQMDIVMIFITSSANTGLEAIAGTCLDSIAPPYEIETTLYNINSIIRNKSSQLDKAIFSTIRSNVLNESNKNFFTVSSTDKIELIRMDDVVYCQADGKYTSFFLKCGKIVLASKNIGEFEVILSKHRFYRIHQSYIVNVLFVARVLKKEGAFCELNTGRIVPIAYRRQEEFYRYLSRK